MKMPKVGNMVETKFGRGRIEHFTHKGYVAELVDNGLRVEVELDHKSKPKDFQPQKNKKKQQDGFLSGDTQRKLSDEKSGNLKPQTQEPQTQESKKETDRSKKSDESRQRQNQQAGNQVKGFFANLKAAHQGIPESQLFVAKCFESGFEAERDYDEAIKWYHEAAENGHVEAQFKLGKHYDSEYGIQPDAQKAARWYGKASEQDHAEAQCYFGLCVLAGLGVEKNAEDGFKWLMRSAKQGNSEAAFHLANCFLEGEGTERNDQEAFEWMQKSADNGYKRAYLVLGEFYEEGTGADIDFEQAADWYKFAAKHGKKEGKAKYDRLNKVLYYVNKVRSDLGVRIETAEKKAALIEEKNLELKEEIQHRDEACSELEERLEKERREYSERKDKLHELRKNRNRIKASLLSTKEELASKDQQIESLKEKISKSDDLLGDPDSAISRWLLSYAGPDSLNLPKKIGTVGSEPYEEAVFDEMIEGVGFTGMIPNGSNGIVVVGREDVEIDEFVDALGLDTGNHPKIYSQEMFIIFMMTGKDPFDAPPEVLYEFAKGHPVLEALMEIDFEWPAVHEREPSDEGVIVIDGQLWHSQSPLTAMGYHVGKTGLKAAQRRRILKKIMEHRLQFPRGFSSSEKSEWGQAASSTRLKKIANHIAFNVSFRSTQTRYRYAVKDWKSDLAWLKKTYYHKMKRRFSWPGV